MTNSTKQNTANVVVFITGFGPFAHIKVNPSSAIAKHVAGSLNGVVSAVHFTELETSIVAVTAYFDSLQPKINDILATDPTTKVLLFHIGVHGSEKEAVMRAEVCGYNELFASVPDFNGVMFNHDPIFAEDGPITTSIESWFGKTGTPQLTQLEEAITSMNAENAKEKATHEANPNAGKNETNNAELKMPVFQCADWIISRDAGRYLCNCTLYRATKLQEKHSGRVFGVFIHVCDPTQGKEESEGGQVTEYNPTLLTQGEQVKKLMHHLLSMIAHAT